MPDRYRRVYWDANCFLAYINEEAEHMPMLDALLEESRNANIIIVTSVLSVTEVAFAAVEKEQRALDPEVENAINDLFSDREVVRLAEYHELVAREAAYLIRDAMVNGWSLKPIDAIHLATAKRLNVAEFHTLDGPLVKYGGPLDFPIHAPRTDRPRLPLPESPPLAVAKVDAAPHAELTEATNAEEESPPVIEGEPPAAPDEANE